MRTNFNSLVVKATAARLRFVYGKGATVQATDAPNGSTVSLDYRGARVLFVSTDVGECVVCLPSGAMLVEASTGNVQGDSGRLRRMAGPFLATL